jgi:cytochrome c-type biogenesis protein CcmH
MSLWLLLALMTAVAIFAVLWPLGRGARPDRDGRESAVYKDQLAEIDRDVAAGLIGPAEGDAARVEIGRRLLAAADAEQDARPAPRVGLRRAVAVVALIALPVLAGGLYLRLGSPGMPDEPLASRAPTSVASASLGQLIEQVQAHLEKNPTDGRGWTVLAPVLVRLGQFDEAVQAYKNAIKYGGDTAAKRAGLGEAIAATANGVITDDAKTEFERAVKLSADEPKARYFLGIAAEQDGHPEQAAAIWKAMLDKAPADAPWRASVEAALARVGAAKMPALSDEQVAAASGMNAGDRNTMIRGMVERLATRLKQDGSDVQGWLRLVRAYMVLGDHDKARNAGSDARKALEHDDARLRQLNDGLKALGLEG